MGNSSSIVNPFTNKVVPEPQPHSQEQANKQEDKTQNRDHVFTLHLPGLKRTTLFHWPKKDGSSRNSMIVDYKFSNFICNSLGVTPRRAKIYRLNIEGADEIFSCSGQGLEIFDGDTLILVVRKTKDESMNEYYNTQIETLMNNMYLEPRISKTTAAYLLTQIEMNYLAGDFYETQQSYYTRLQNYT